LEYNKNNWIDDENDLINPHLKGNLDEGIDECEDTLITIDYETLYKNLLQETEQLKLKLKQVEEPIKKKVIKVKK